MSELFAVCLNTPVESDRYRKPAPMGDDQTVTDLKRWIAANYRGFEAEPGQVSVYYDSEEIKSDEKLSYFIGGTWSYHVHKKFILRTEDHEDSTHSHYAGDMKGICRSKKVTCGAFLSTFQRSLPRGHILLCTDGNKYDRNDTIDTTRLPNDTVFRLVLDERYVKNNCHLRTHFDDAKIQFLSKRDGSDLKEEFLKHVTTMGSSLKVNQRDHLFHQERVRGLWRHHAVAVGIAGGQGLCGDKR